MCEVRVLVLNKVVRKGITEKIALSKDPERRSHGNIWV